MASISNSISADWVDYYYNANWNTEIPPPPQGWGSDAKEIEQLDASKQCSQKLFITINHIQKYPTSKFWLWDLASKTVNFKKENDIA